jgi:rhodanese-related sulfurtransferase
LAGALKAIPDESGSRVVVIFADSAFKYASSVVKHLAGLGATPTRSNSRREELLDAMIENARHNPNLTIDVESAHEIWKRERPLVVDVRDPGIYSRSHIANAVNIPLLDLPDRIGELPDDRDAPVLSVCQVGNTSLSGVLYLNSLGYQNARSITGGTSAWQACGFATESG